MITTVVGNFPKVAEPGYGTQVIGALNRWQKQELSDAGLEEVFQGVTRTVIKEHEDAGIDLVTDGQIRWEDLVTPLARKLDGFTINGLERFFDNNVYYRKPILQSKPVRKQPVFLQEYLFAKRCTSRPIKVVLPGPYTFVSLSEDRYYRNQAKFLRRMAEILNEEARALAQAGASLIQFDEPALGFGKPPLKEIRGALQVAVAGLPTKTALYTYFGSVTAETLRMLQRVPVDLIGVDVVSDPKVLGAVRRLKWTKELAVGCLDARNTKLESVTELHALFDVLRRLVPTDRFTVNPNCGLEFLPHRQAVEKIRRLAEAVRTYRPDSNGRSLAARPRTGRRRTTRLAPRGSRTGDR